MLPADVDGDPTDRTPAQNATLVSTTPSLVWGASAGATSYECLVEPVHGLVDELIGLVFQSTQLGGRFGEMPVILERVFQDLRCHDHLLGDLVE